MLSRAASRIMARTTLNIDDPVLRDLRRLQRKRHQTLGRIVSDLLAEAVARSAAEEGPRPPFRWMSQRMEARVDLGDKEAVWAALEAGDRGA
jgi:hypothetical protein